MIGAKGRASLLALAMAGLIPTSASALPAYAEQTGMPCQTCHVGGFGPQLTAFGRTFKLNGYTMRAGNSFTVPVSVMAMAGYVHTLKDQPAPPAPHYATNDNFTIDQLNVFLAGGIGDHFGGFAQFTYDGVGRVFGWDNLDLRATDHETIWDSDVLLGLTLNNNPTVQDPWNTTPAWGFPYTSSDLSPSPAASPLVAGAFGGNTLGITAYTLLNSTYYVEAGAYWTPGHGFLRALGASADAGTIDGAAPYVRVAYQKDYGDQNFEIGAFGMFPDVRPPDVVVSSTDNYTDVGIDASYMYAGDGSNIYGLNARYTHEHQGLAASFAAGNAANRSNSLEDFRVDLFYYWHNELGLTVQPFDTWGTADTMLYADNRTFTPNSSGVTFQADYTPFPNADSPLGARFNMRVGIQYTVYGEFNGASSNFDGLGSNASDNNTVRLFTWLAY